MTHPPGSIIIASGHLSRYAAFSRSLTSLQTPPGTKTVWGIGSDICKNFNGALAQRVGAWVWIMGDDHVFAPDTLLRLLDRQVDVVSPHVTSRTWPFVSFVFRDHPETQEMTLVPREELPASGLHRVDGCSGAGLLIREPVWHALTPPYYEPGCIRQGELNEDTWLMTKIRRAGFTIHVDFDVRMGHQTPAVIWPRLNEAGRWDIEIDMLCRVPEESYTQGL